MAYTPLSGTLFAKRPSLPSTFGLQILRDQLPLTTWLLIGAALQSVLYLLPLRPAYALAPAFIVLLFKTIDTLLITYNLKPNPYLEGTITERTTALVPNSDGTFGEPSADAESNNDQIAVLILGFASNHPLGTFAPGAREIGSHFGKMIKDLKTNAETNGFLGSSNSLSNPQSRSSKSDIVTTFYFRSMQDVQNFAHGPVHREGWNWWNKIHQTYRHLMIYHEVYEAPKGGFENVAMHARPGGISTTLFPVKTKDGNGWISPLVSAAKGKLVTATGRRAAYSP